MTKTFVLFWKVQKLFHSGPDLPNHLIIPQLPCITIMLPYDTHQTYLRTISVTLFWIWLEKSLLTFSDILTVFFLTISNQLKPTLQWSYRLAEKNISMTSFFMPLLCFTHVLMIKSCLSLRGANDEELSREMMCFANFPCSPILASC